jgi:hypothetical protein
MNALVLGRRWIRVVALCLMAVALVMPALPASAAGTVTWRSYDVTVEVRNDGTLHVTEDIGVEFDGSFTQGHRAIPLNRIEEIRDLWVAVENADGAVTRSRHLDRADYSGEPGTFTTYVEDNELKIDYGFLPTGTATNATDLRQIVIEYDALGAIRVYDDVAEPYQEIRWTAIAGEVSEVGDIDAASATILFPEDVPADQTRFDPEPRSVTPDRVTWERTNLTGGDSLMVLAAFSPITNAIEPSWQPDAEKLDKQKEREDTVLGLSLLAGPTMAIGFGLLMLFMRRASGRNAYVGLVADMLNEPPDSLPAGLVGALIDRSFDAKDAVAMLVDLDRRGVIEMRERGIKGKGEDDPARFACVLLQPIADAQAWERSMLEGLFGKNATPGKEVSFAALKELRAKHQSSVSGALEQELFERGLYEELPETTRNRWMLRALGLAAGCALAAGAMALWTRSFPAPVIVLLAGIGVLFVIALLVANTSTVKSVAGEEATAKWKAFGRYLDRMEKEMPVADRLALFGRYLPWAIALGFDNSWKSWMSDGRRDDDAEENDGDWSPLPATSASGGGRMPGMDLQGMSNRGLSGIQSGSSAVFVMLNTAVSSFNAGSESSSNGGSSGSSSVGSSGGGSHSFS